MNRSRWIAAIVVFGSVIVAAFGIWAASILIGSLSSAPSPLASALLAALAGAFGWLVTRFASRADAASLAHREKKIAIYSQFVTAVLHDFTPEQFRGASKEAPDLAQEMVNFQREILFWGSPKVIRAYSALRENPNDRRSTALRLNNLFAAMRADIGLSNFGLNPNDLMKLMVSEPKAYDDFVAGRK